MTLPTQRTVTLARGCVATSRTLRATTTREEDATRHCTVVVLPDGGGGGRGGSVVLRRFPLGVRSWEEDGHGRDRGLRASKIRGCGVRYSTPGGQARE